MARPTSSAKGDDRNPARAHNNLLKGISDHQWRAWKAVAALADGQQIGTVEALQQAADEALRWLTQETRLDPEPGEARVWHRAHKTGEDCWYCDKMKW